MFDVALLVLFGACEVLALACIFMGVCTWRKNNGVR